MKIVSKVGLRTSQRLCFDAAHLSVMSFHQLLQYIYLLYPSLTKSHYYIDVLLSHSFATHTILIQRLEHRKNAGEIAHCLENVFIDLKSFFHTFQQGYSFPQNKARFFIRMISFHFSHQLPLKVICNFSCSKSGT